MTRHELRYKTMTILYQAFLYENNNIEYNIDSIIQEQLEESDKFVTELVNGVMTNREEIDNLANSYLADWEISRLGFTDQAIIRMGIYEIMWTDTPDVTCIDEAVELAKEYSDEKVCKMINGILDKVYHSKGNNE
jgi:N utilization substance protein B